MPRFMLCLFNFTLFFDETFKILFSYIQDSFLKNASDLFPVKPVFLHQNFKTTQNFLLVSFALRALNKILGLIVTDWFVIYEKICNMDGH